MTTPPTTTVAAWMAFGLHGPPVRDQTIEGYGRGSDGSVRPEDAGP